MKGLKMRIELDGTYSLTTDENNFTLNETKFYGKDSKNFGESYEKTIGYYGTLKSALKGFLKYATRTATYGGAEITTIEELMAKLESIEKKIDSALVSV